MDTPTLFDSRQSSLENARRCKCLNACSAVAEMLMHLPSMNRSFRTLESPQQYEIAEYTVSPRCRSCTVFRLHESGAPLPRGVLPVKCSRRISFAAVSSGVYAMLLNLWPLEAMHILGAAPSSFPSASSAFGSSKLFLLPRLLSRVARTDASQFERLSYLCALDSFLSPSFILDTDPLSRSGSILDDDSKG